MGIFAGAIPKKQTLMGVPVESDVTLGPSLSSFLGCKKTANILAMPYGQLISNKNMEYLYSGNNVYLNTKRGSTLILDITNVSYGAALYTYNLSTEYFVWVDGVSIKRCDTDGSTLTTVTSALTTSKESSWYMYGQETNATLYGCNGSDNIFKVSGSTPTYAAISNSPQATDITFSTMGGRLISVYKHSISWTERQIGTGVTNLEDWGYNSVNAAYDNTELISPDDGAGFIKVLDLGVKGVYLFKDTGVWCLPNINESPIDWRFPQVANISTNAKKTVQVVRYNNVEAVIYLATDKELKLFIPQVQYNAGSLPTVANTDVKTISDTFQTLLDAIPTTYLNKCTATYDGRYYLLNFPSASGSTTIDKTIIVDVSKLLAPEGEGIPQPYWLESENMDYVDFISRKSVNKIYGFNKNGYIAEILVADKYVEEMPTRVTPTQDYEDSGTTRSVTIEYNAFTGWHDFSKVMGGGYELELVRGYVHYSTDGSWGLKFVSNAFRRGEEIPDYDVGLEGTLTPSSSAGGFFDVSLFDVATFAGTIGSISQNINVRNRGHFFIFGFYSTTYNEPATIYSIDPIFKHQRFDPVGSR